MKRFLILLLLSMTGCSDWNENRAEFRNYSEFVASDMHSGWIPPTLVPPSAKKIRLATNVDLNVAFIEFDFESGHAARMLQGFNPVSDDQRKRLSSGDLLRAAPGEDSTLSVRCDTKNVEFLLVDNPAHATYWTTRSDRIKKIVCGQGRKAHS